MELGYYFAFAFVWVAVVWLLRRRRYELLQNICHSALSESDTTRRQTLVWFAHYLLTSLELNFEVKAAMSFRGLLATCVLGGNSPFPTFQNAFSAMRRGAMLTWSCLYESSTKIAAILVDLPITPVYVPNIRHAVYSAHGHERFKKAILRLNTIHNHYGSLICESDMLYVLSIFATMGSLFCRSRWFSIRSFSHAENEIAFLHWINIGRLMGIKVDDANWKCFRDVLSYKNDYEAKYRNAFPSWSRFFILPASMRVVSAMQADSETSAALGLPQPSVFLRICVFTLLILRSLLFRFFIPPTPLAFSERVCPTTGQLISGNFEYFPTKMGFGNDTYSRFKGYVIENMGPAVVPRSILTEQPKYSGSPFRP